MNSAALQFLSFELSDGDDGIVTLDAMASTRGDQQPAVRAEVEQVLAWAREQFPNSQGPVEEGMDWDHELLEQQEAGGWFTVTLTLSASPAFAEAFLARFGEAED
ncbi:hypothetical protein [Pelomonas sp. SE-A7]|uniref:hypothetical protein n=1 Tax=Pelomonas sp. SE-A7 TaxID=3054953 RepID=UPI00259CF6BE|nr:hypothetical protein [Pelomonas sp. SE-A7]MDM4766558.1 hypothetical protein [Pelomonas sp. SE-A7]